MSEVFYRKWRPRRLDQVIGQEPVVQTLRNAVVLGRVAHAYLFCGPRGTGKTSTARILAKAVNCLSPQDGEPDNQCEICVSIDEARALDLIEIDAASNRGIDDMRDLRDKVHFTPSQARYKVYIVDEVHMLTEPAFNALLKTLEEPPQHVKFILCTTEVHKVPLTIISRCQRFDFRRIPSEAVADRLAKLCADEKVEASPDALRLIARASAGSLRDAENLLEQALVSYNSPLSEEEVRDLLGLGGDEKALELAGHVSSRAVAEGLTVINQAAAEGSDLRQLHRGVMEYLRGLLLIKFGAHASLDYPEETSAQMRSQAEQASQQHLVRALKSFAKVDLRRDTSSTLLLELALIESSLDADVRAAAPAPTPGATEAVPVGTPDAVPERSGLRPGTAQGSIPAPVDSGEANVQRGPERRAQTAPVGGTVAGPRTTPDRPRPSSDSERPPAGADAQGARESVSDGVPSEALSSRDGRWIEVLNSMRRHKGKRFNVGALLRDCREREVADGLITLKFSHRSHMERMQEELQYPQTLKVLKETFAKAFDGSYEIQVGLVEGEGSGRRQSASQRSHLVRTAQAMGARVVGEREEDSE